MVKGPSGEEKRRGYIWWYRSGNCEGGRGVTTLKAGKEGVYTILCNYV